MLIFKCLRDPNDEIVGKFRHLKESNHPAFILFNLNLQGHEFLFSLFYYSCHFYFFQGDPYLSNNKKHNHLIDMLAFYQ